MSVKIRLSQVGKKHQISYRIVATDTRTKRDGAFLEILGSYIPKSKPQIKHDRVNFWLAKGAKPSPTVARLIENIDDRGSKLEAGS